MLYNMPREFIVGLVDLAIQTPKLQHYIKLQGSGSRGRVTGQERPR